MTDDLLHRKIRVLHVEDDHTIEQDADEKIFRRSAEQIRSTFWCEAAKLCSAHGSHDPNRPCPDCAFDLTFCPWFPEAAFALLRGERFDVYIVDIAPSSHPRNRLEHKDYAKDLQDLGSQIKDKHGQPFPRNIPLSGLEVLHLIRFSASGIEPIVAHYSNRRPLDAELADLCTISYSGTPAELQPLLQLALARARFFVSNSLSIRLPRIVLGTPAEAPVSMTFSARSPAVLLRITPHTAMEGADNLRLSTATSPQQFSYNKPRLRVRSLRHCIRMGEAGTKPPLSGGGKDELRGVSEALDVTIDQCDELTAQVLRWLNTLVVKRGERKYWRSHDAVETSVESAWQSFYYGIVLITVAMREMKNRSPAVDKALDSARYSVLSNDASLLRFGHATIPTARKFFDIALGLGSDICDVDPLPDLELSVMPKLGQVCCDILEDGEVEGPPTDQTQRRCQEIFLEIGRFILVEWRETLQGTAWLREMNTGEYLAALNAVANESVGGDRLLAKLIEGYAEGNSMYRSAYKLVEDLTLAR